MVGPAKGDGDLGPGAIAGVGDGVFYVNGEHPTGGELPISSVLSGGKAPEDSGNHFVVTLEGILVVPRWSAASGSIIVVVVQLFGLELLSQAEAILHLMLGVLVERARAIEDLLVLLIIVVLGSRLINSGDDMVWSAAAILTRLGAF